MQEVIYLVLKLSILELIFRAIPEGFLHIMAVYVFSREKINLRKIITSGCLLGFIIFFIRILPIQFGIHTLIFLGTIILISICVNKIDTNKAISSSLVSTMILSICDSGNFFLIKDIFKINLKVIMSNPSLKVVYGLPSLVLYIFIILIAYKIIYKNRRVF